MTDAVWVPAADENGISALVPLAVPKDVRISEDGERVEFGGAITRLEHVWVGSPSALERVSRLHRLDEATLHQEICSLVATYGPLGLCAHGKPKGHLSAELVREMRRVLDAQHPWDRVPDADHADEDDPPWWDWVSCTGPGMPFDPRRPRGGDLEAVAGWVAISKQAQALHDLAQVTVRLRESAKEPLDDAGRWKPPRGVPTLDDIMPLADLLPDDFDLLGYWTDPTDPDGRRRLLDKRRVPDGEPVGLMPDDPMLQQDYLRRVREADSHRLPAGDWWRDEFPWSQLAVALVALELPRLLELATQEWLNWADLRLRFALDPQSGTARLRFGNGTLFSLIAMQFALTSAGIHSLAVCDACRAVHQPESRGRRGQFIYCNDCRSSPDYDAIRKAMSRYGRMDPHPKVKPATPG